MHEARGNTIKDLCKRNEAVFQKQAQQYPALLTARLVRQKDEASGDNAVVVLTERIYQCEDGSYWLFICQSGEPRHLIQLHLERAKNLLRSTPDIFVKEFPEET
ncbi:hypothetical protein SAMN05216350_10437 [Polaromonas sp. YR568]|nr:hypothetical protein SAMN05216350_10437 [Polaromonas sp. YR568]